METAITENQPTNLPTPTRIGKHRTPPGHRILHLVIPDRTFAQLHRAAIDSNMKFTHYMHRFLQEAFPYDTPPRADPTP